MEKPILSICIPTYNRSEYLQRTIQSIISQPEFSRGEVEIIISDNCSTDNTREVCEDFVKKYRNIRYHRNETNMGNVNFPIVLRLANGIFRKLANDTLMFQDGALGKLINLVKDNQDIRPILFCSNEKGQNKQVSSLDELMYVISFNITWIGAFGLWDNDIQYLEGTEPECETHLWQVPTLMDTFLRHKQGLIINDNIFETQLVRKKNLSYGLYDIFYVNYMNYIKKFETNGHLSKECVQFLEKDLLYHFFTNWIINYEMDKDKYIVAAQDEDLKQIIFSTYENMEYYSKYLWYYKYSFLRRKLVLFIKKIIKR